MGPPREVGSFLFLRLRGRCEGAIHTIGPGMCRSLQSRDRLIPGMKRTTPLPGMD